MVLLTYIRYTIIHGLFNLRGTQYFYAKKSIKVVSEDFYILILSLREVNFLLTETQAWCVAKNLTVNIFKHLQHKIVKLLGL